MRELPALAVKEQMGKIKRLLRIRGYDISNLKSSDEYGIINF
jgi:uncharacterized protein with PIN domain